MATFSPRQRQNCISKIRDKDTLPEILVRKRRFVHGWWYGMCDKRFQGKLDIVVPLNKTIIDMCGCFWHKYGCKDSMMSKSNIAFWMERWLGNVKRDQCNEDAWRDVCWDLIIAWQCALEGDNAARVLDIVCAKMKSWAVEYAASKSRPCPHWFELLQTRRRGK